MTSTHASRRDVFSTITQTSYYDWPAYDSTPLYDRSSLNGLKADIRTVATVWFDHGAHESVDRFVCHLPLAYAEFQPHDRYIGPARYEMSSLIRAFLLKELYGWNHETALVEYLQQHPSLCCKLGFDSVPDQSTLWRSWHRRFTDGLRDTVESTAETIWFRPVSRFNNIYA